MAVSEQDIKFASFILAKSGKQHLLQPILDRCERDDITVWTHFEQGLIQQYGHSQPEAQRKVQEWFTEFLAGQQPAATGATAAAEPDAVTSEAPPPVTSRSRAWWWVLGVLLAGGAAAYYFLYMKKPGEKAPDTLYVLAEDGLVLRTNTNCDTAENKKILNIAYNKPVELLEKIDSSRNWVKVRVPGTQGAGGKPQEGYVAEYRMLGTKEVNLSLDSIYRDRAWNPQAERLSYPLKKSLYQYIKNANFDWYVDPVTDNTSFQNVIDLSKKIYGKAVINNCALTTYTKYRVAILTSRSGGGVKKALIFSLTGNYTSEKVDERDLSDLADPILYKTGSDVYITDGRNKDAKRYQVKKNSSGIPYFDIWQPPLIPFPMDPYDYGPDSLQVPVDQTFDQRP